MYKVLGNVDFPSPQGIKVNMMPFVLGDSQSLPENMRQYVPMIDACEAKFNGEVCYLTVNESYVNVGKSQRRGGIHTEAPSNGRWGGNPWGGNGGVWMNSTQSNTCKVWSQEVPENKLGNGGDCSHLDFSDEDAYYLQAGELVQMSDRTPHEAIPQNKSGYRQFFRLVGPDIYGWFTEHNTRNPLCALPFNIPVITKNKFACK